MFMVHDQNRPDEAWVVYPDPALLKKHNVSAKAFEAAFRDSLDVFGEAIAKAVVEVFFEPSERDHNQQSSSTSKQEMESRFGLTSKAFREILEATRMEIWKLHADGTHAVIEKIPPKTSTLPKSGAPSPQRQPGIPSGREIKFSRKPFSLEEAKKAFTKNTGITWPDSARDVHFDQKRDNFFGDGETYVVFALPADIMMSWLESSPPWDAKKWSRGPILRELQLYCTFGYDRPSTRTADEGASELLTILNSEEVRYAARSRSVSSNPWYNGDILIVDPRAGVVRWSSWDN